jgi:hypothetical protein
MRRVDEVYVTDAYHSLSIGGYRVTPELIERVRRGSWNPQAHEQDREQTNAMAARGYWQASQFVEKSIGRVLKGENPGVVAEEDHREWYREMLAPSVIAGILKPSDLAGYRNGQVYIRQSMHVPLSRDAVRDAMPAFFDLLTKKPIPPCASCSAFHIRLYPPIYGRQRTHGRVPDEPHDGRWRITVDGYTAVGAQGLYIRARKGERRRGHWTICGFSRPSRRESSGG